ncbi:unnamed protein product [Paramecium octaurelia]|uniref:HTH myb-type domain-containing protein n=1 Tax=Paramecium octaurelia TaxID=43137 RepID=A0A8S1Y8X1_PAROT|nr:unnamed protein product [Paramecium octaurelia]
MKDIDSISTLNEQSKDQLLDSSSVEPSIQNKNHQNVIQAHEAQGSAKRKSYIKKKKKQRQGRKSRDFTIQEDQKLLGFILTFGPKFKIIQRKMSGRPLNILKNRYYRDLRYRWDEVLGEEFAHLNEMKINLIPDEILKNPPFDPDLSKIMMDMMNQMQNIITKCLN